MAYIPEREPFSAWNKLIMRYRLFSGSWAYLLQRLTGIGLVAYLFLHIWALTSLTRGRAAFAAEMVTFTTPLFKFLEWALGALIMFHAFNGIRIAIVDLANGARYHKKLLAAVWVTGIAVVIMMFFLIFSNTLFAK
ncbi:MAG TPA: succinate dehydrogenase, cytochrome b556 subunit [Candidatus Kapabacteria bacterium]